MESRLSREKANQGQTEWHIQLKTPQADAVWAVKIWPVSMNHKSGDANRKKKTTIQSAS